MKDSYAGDQVNQEQPPKIDYAKESLEAGPGNVVKFPKSRAAQEEWESKDALPRAQLAKVNRKIKGRK